MRSYLGTYNAPPGTENDELSMLVFDKAIHIGYYDQHGKHQTLQWNIKDVEAVFDMPSQVTKVKNSTHGHFEIQVNGNDAAAYIREMKDELAKPWHQKSSFKTVRRNLLILTGFLLVLVVVYFLLVPWMSEKLASNVSITTEKKLGDAVYDALHIEAQKDADATASANEFFKMMHVHTGYDIRVSVVKGSTVNAFALPGGHIVIYTALIDKMQSYPELAALLSHEFSHVNNKHSTRAIFRRMGSRIFIRFLFGNASSVASVLANNADDLTSLKYSRSLEKEADMKGLSILLERKIDPRGFSNLFNHLKESAGSALPEFMGSHPDIDKRISYISDAATAAEVEENSQLKATFEQLKQNIQ